jgi:hypothetical protein
MNVKRLDGRMLNYWVAKSAGLTLAADPPAAGQGHDPQGSVWHPNSYNPANDWSHAGSLVANEWFAIEDMLIEWFGPHWPHIPSISEHPLTWFLRAYVATQYGDEVESVDFSPAQEAQERVRAAVTSPPGHANKKALSAWFRPISW